MLPSTARMTDRLWRQLNSRKQLFLIAGPCVLEDESMALEIGLHLRRICRRLGITYVFKASFDKANRSSGTSFRGPGLEEGLAILGRLRQRLEVPVLTDVHLVEQVVPAARVVDILQIPAFLCRQTDLVTAAAATGQVVNLKKGQFMAPDEMTSVVAKASEALGGQRPKLLLTERGTTFGYHNLVADMRSLPILGRLGFPVIFDATHSVQLPGAAGGKSGGQREFAPVLARCAVVAGANGLFIETHPDPDKALSDGPNMIPIKDMAPLLTQLCRLRHALGSGI
ncbi:MAG: 3-deoxy-8-phosphooctulonate synthase [Limisphaerales bacterium]